MRIYEANADKRKWVNEFPGATTIFQIFDGNIVF